MRGAAARRQDDKDRASNLLCDLELRERGDVTGRTDRHRRRGRAFEFANDCGADGATFVGIGTDVQVRCCDRYQDGKGYARQHHDNAARQCKRTLPTQHVGFYLTDEVMGSASVRR